MKVKIDMCCGCSSVDYPCLGEACDRYGEREVVACDECEHDNCDIYEYEGQELCLSCIAKKLDKVEI